MSLATLADEIALAVERKPLGEDVAATVKAVLDKHLGYTRRNIADAMGEAIQWWCIEGKEPPYEVPCAMDADLWKWTKTTSRPKAVATYRAAIDGLLRDLAD